MSEVQPEEKGKMLPGIAGIAMFLLLVTIINVIGVFTGADGTGVNKYGPLSLLTILLAGLFGLLRMKRWGHSIVMAGCLLLSAWFFYVYSKNHFRPYIVEGLFALVFFLYLVRPEVRDRML